MNWTITTVPPTLEPRISKVHAQHESYAVLLSPDISTGQTMQGPVSYAPSIPLSEFHLYQKDSNRQKVRELPEYHIVSSSPFLCESGQLKNVSLMLIAKTQTQRQREKNTARNVVGWMVVKRQSGIRVLQLTKGTPSLPVFLPHTSLRKPSSHFALVHRAESHIVEVCTPKITIYRCGGGTGWHLKIWMPEDTPK